MIEERSRQQRQVGLQGEKGSWSPGPHPLEAPATTRIIKRPQQVTMMVCEDDCVPATRSASGPHFLDDEGEAQGWPGGASPGAQLGSDTVGPGQPGPRGHYPPASHLSKGEGWSQYSISSRENIGELPARFLLSSIQPQ